MSKTMREIHRSDLLSNIEDMINALEYDSMRSAGKCKMNASTLVDLYNLQAIYKTTPATKQTTKSTK